MSLAAGPAVPEEGQAQPSALAPAEMRSAHSCENQGDTEHGRPRQLHCGQKGTSEMS